MQLRLLGPMAVVADGEALQLPASRKTRALLGYLAAEGKPVRRDRLTHLFWEVPDDPKGALRWSLSKLRGLFGDAIVADRETAAAPSMSTMPGFATLLPTSVLSPLKPSSSCAPAPPARSWRIWTSPSSTILPPGESPPVPCCASRRP